MKRVGGGHLDPHRQEGRDGQGIQGKIWPVTR